MISSHTMYWLDQRCRAATGRAEVPFGGLNIIMMGDLGQLPPVGGTPVFVKPKKRDDELTQTAYTLWREFKTVVWLNSNWRQRDQEEWFKMLLRIRNGDVDKSTWEMLLTRAPYGLPDEEVRAFEEATHLFYTNHEADEMNEQCLERLRHPITLSKAAHTGRKSATATINQAGGLLPNLRLCVGARVMLVDNLWPEAGLANGACGTVIQIVYEDNDAPPRIPTAVIVQFDQYSGPSVLADKERCVPIVAMTHTWYTKQGEASRRQIPLRLCWAMTIHKSQGQTLDKAVIDLGPRKSNAGVTFVGLSRVRALEHLLIKPMGLDRIVSIGKAIGLRSRITEDRRLYGLYERLRHEHDAMMSAIADEAP